MIEIPEAVTLCRQLSKCFSNRKIDRIVAGESPHKFTWFYGDRERYTEIAYGKSVDGAKAVGGMVQVAAGDVRLLSSEGARLRHLGPSSLPPREHQFLVTFSCGSALAVSVQMYGGIGVFSEGENENPHLSSLP